VDYGVKQINLNGKDLKIDFWDLAGGNEYVEIRNEFYKDTSGVKITLAIQNELNFY
jgi:DnaJ family protein C protein 27